MTFFAMLARELVKDAEDVEGDQASGAVTIPIRFGIRATVFLAPSVPCWGQLQVWCRTSGGDSGTFSGFSRLMVSSFSPVSRAVGSTTPSGVKASRASALLKAGMFISLVVFTLSALFL